MGRVNSFLYALRNGRFRSGKHDQDLLPSGHPMSTKKSLKGSHDEVYDNRVDAQERAEAIGCSTTHTHETEDGLIYMPCRNMDELEEALSKYQHDEDEEETKQETYDNYPKSARNNAEKAKKINESFNNPCATLVGKNRANDLIAGRPLSLDIVKKTFSYLSRAHEYVTGNYIDEKDKPICGDISFSLWGGSNKVKNVSDDPMYKWCKKILEKEENASS